MTFLPLRMPERRYAMNELDRALRSCDDEVERLELLSHIANQGSEAGFSAGAVAEAKARMNQD